MLRLALGFALPDTQPLEFVDDIVTGELAPSSPDQTFWRSPHQIVCLGFPNDCEFQPFVEPPCRMIDLENLQFDRNAPAVGLVQQALDQLRPDPTALMVGCDLDDAEKDEVVSLLGSRNHLESRAGARFA